MIARRTKSRFDTLQTTVPVVIFGLSRGVFHHGALGITRSAGRLGIPVYRVCQERWAPATLSRYASPCMIVSKDATTDQTLRTLREFSRQHGRAVLIPVDDVSAMFVDEHSATLGQDFLFPHQPSGLARELASKREMFRLCSEHDVPTPLSVFPESESQVIKLTQEWEFPVVLKRIDASLPALPGAPSVSIAQDHEQLLVAYRLMESPEIPNVMLQEYVPGTPESIWMFNGYFDAHSECRLAFTGQKIRQSPPDTGATTLGVCRPNAVVEQTTKRFMKAIGYRGILDIGYRFDPRDGQYKLLDVNPRIGATFRLFVGTNGMDALRALYLDLTGQEIRPTKQLDGRRWIVEPLDLRSSVTYLRRGDITAGAWARSFRGIREGAWFSTDDPLPFLALWIRLLVDWLPRRILKR